jgi:hypothetical protein
VLRPNPQARRRVIEMLVFACLALGSWIIVLYFTLPRRYDATHWDLAWIGFDIALLIGLVATAWAAWRRRVVIVFFATATSTLIFADVWFDVTTARSSDLWVSATQAIFIELPFAAFLLFVVVRVVSFTRGTIWSDRFGTRPRSLWSVEFVHPSEIEDVAIDPNPISRHGEGQSD